jgi:hypothetical protein
MLDVYQRLSVRRFVVTRTITMALFGGRTRVYETSETVIMHLSTHMVTVPVSLVLAAFTSGEFR